MASRTKRSRQPIGEKMGRSSSGKKKSAPEYRPWQLKGGVSTRWATTAARTWFSALMPPRVPKSGDTPIRSRSMPRQFEGGPAGTPTVDGDRVYTLSHEGDLFCLCRLQWQGALEKKFAERLRRKPPEMGVRWFALGGWQSRDCRFGRRGRIDALRWIRQPERLSGKRGTTRRAIQARSPLIWPELAASLFSKRTR